MDLRAIVGEVESGAAGGGEDGGAVGGRERIVQMAFGGVAGLHQIAEVQVDIVEDECHETVGHYGRLIRAGRRSGVQALAVGMGAITGLLDGKVSDVLGLALVEDLEIFLTQVAERLPVGIAHDHGDQHQIDFGSESGRRVVRAHLSRIRIGGLRRRMPDATMLAMTIPKMRHGLFTSPGMQSVYSTPYMSHRARPSGSGFRYAVTAWTSYSLHPPRRWPARSAGSKSLRKKRPRLV